MVQRGQTQLHLYFSILSIQNYIDIFLQGKTHKGEDMVWISIKSFKRVMIKAM